MFKNGWKKKFKDYLNRKKKFFILVAIVLVAFSYLKFSAKNSRGSETAGVRSAKVKIDKNFQFPGLNNQGKTVSDKIKFKLTDVERTDTVLVKDQSFTAKNNKLFLIVHLELTNDATQLVNLLPGDLIRLSVGEDTGTRFAPDLHNNLVPVAAISTKLDRVGFVIPDDSKKFIIYVGEIEGNKQEINVVFPS
ncbi:hypothetical protein A2777_05415 [Candidatus Gottesmanbacteria bacterium RIFCSPHIGHO2_01_FULL_40_15]|uniref:DUF4352 domain-containing protein n=1 Tax=Candidatus Gottesmanbacteria bacterium RIFCSPHIGHO2_01_FULL_40_15 TaxID=1798376 RepID=A0A1F5Z1P8_9BACT|nr:MAG: hypothetical protein A2777_05415 [Candidatus Gottesmanbacteria bacterium RIFCSPHIGHO2_01_FULL_40_15]